MIRPEEYYLITMVVSTKHFIRSQKTDLLHRYSFWPVICCSSYSEIHIRSVETAYRTFYNKNSSTLSFCSKACAIGVVVLKLIQNFKNRTCRKFLDAPRELQENIADLGPPHCRTAQKPAQWHIRQINFKTCSDNSSLQDQT